MGKRIWAVVLGCALAVSMLAMTGCTSNKEPYTPQMKTPTVSSSAIGQEGVLRVGVDTGNPPLAGTVSDKIVGLDVDIAAALADSMGLKLSIVDVGSDPQTALEEGKVDIIMGVDKSNSDVTFWTSDSYLSTGVALMSLSGNAAVPTNGSGATFAAQVSSKSAWSVMNEFGESSLTATSDLASAFAELQSGNVDYVAADAVIGVYAAHGKNMDVSIVALLQQPSGYCVGVLDSNSELKQAVGDAVSSLSTNGVISVIEKKWLGQPLSLLNTPLTEGASAVASLSES